MDNNIHEVGFGNSTLTQIEQLYQYDKGQILKITDKVEDGTEVQFSNNNSELTINKAIVGSQVEIPNVLLQENKKILAYLKIINSDSETTIKTVIIPVKARTKPADYIEPEQEKPFRKYVEELKTAAEQSASDASTSELNASQSEQNALASELNAKKSEQNASKSATDASTSASNAKKSETAAATSEENARQLTEQLTEDVSQLKEDLDDLSDYTGFRKIITQTKTNSYDFEFSAGKYIVSNAGSVEPTTVTFYKTDVYSSEEETNVKVWNNLNPKYPQNFEINLDSDYNHLRIWQGGSNQSVTTITRIGEIYESKTLSEKLNNNYGIHIFDFIADYSKHTTNNIDVLKKGKNIVFVFEDTPGDLVIRLDTNTIYDGNSENLLTIVEHFSGEKYVSDIITLDKDYNSLIGFDLNNSKKKVHVYEVNTLINDIKTDVNDVETEISDIQDKLQQKKAKELSLEWSQYWFDGIGVTGTILHTNGVASDKIEKDGLYLVTFPDELKATYNVKKYDNPESRLNIASFHPFSIVINDDFLRVRFERKDGGELLPSDSILSDVKIWIIEDLDSECDISVAPSDSTLLKKNKANIILDGLNDTEILASLFGCYNSINVRLYDGTYNINKMWTYSNTAKISLSFNDYNFDGGWGFRRYISVYGETPSTPQTLESVRFCITKELHESLQNDGINYFVIGTPYSLSDDTIQRMTTSCNLRNFNIIGYKYDKPITYIDTTRCLSTMIDSVNIRSWADNITSYNPFNETPNVECCGIRVGRGSNYGIHNYVKHLNVWYCGKGIACNGEHFVFEDVKTHHDYIGFVFGDRKTVGNQEHPNIMIGCSIEGCYRLMVLSKSGVTIEQDYESTYPKSTLVMIGTSTEARWTIPANEVVNEITSQKTLPVKEIIRGAWRGRIEIDWSGELFEAGSGSNFVVTKY